MHLSVLILTLFILTSVKLNLIDTHVIKMGVLVNISVLYWAHLCMKCSLCVSNFLEEISSLSHSIVFLYFFALITEEGFLISSCYSLELCIQMLVSFPFSFASLLFTAICKPSSDKHLTFLHFFFLGVVLIPASCTMSWTSVHSSSGTLSIRSRPLNLFLTSTV